MKWQDKYVRMFEVFFKSEKVSYKNAKKKTIQIPNDLYELIEKDIEYINKEYGNILKSDNEAFIRAIAEFFNCEIKDGEWKKQTGKLPSIKNNDKKTQKKLDKLVNDMLIEEKRKANERVRQYREKEKKEKEKIKKENEKLKRILKEKGVDFDV